MRHQSSFSNIIKHMSTRATYSKNLSCDQIRLNYCWQFWVFCYTQPFTSRAQRDRLFRSCIPMGFLLSSSMHEKPSQNRNQNPLAKCYAIDSRNQFFPLEIYKCVCSCIWDEKQKAKERTKHTRLNYLIISTVR